MKERGRTELDFPLGQASGPLHGSGKRPWIFVFIILYSFFLKRLTNRINFRLPSLDPLWGGVGVPKS